MLAAVFCCYQHPKAKSKCEREREGEEGMGVIDGGGEILAQNDRMFLIQT